MDRKNKIPHEIFISILYNIENMTIKDLINIYYAFYDYNNYRKIIMFEFNKYLDFYISSYENKDDLSSTDKDFENKNRNIISLKLFNINREIEKILYRTEEDEIEEEYINRKNKMIKNLRINNSYIINNIINCFLKCYICKNNDINKMENIYSCSNCEDVICDNCCIKCNECY